MNEPERQIMSLLGEAVEHRSPEERAAFLDKACAGDAGRRARVEELLRAHQAAGNFLQGNRLPAELVATVDEPMRERPGTVIGTYKLLEQIGEGGFGVVFMAEQNQPVRRKVALKVLKPGMDTRQVVARFEAERQALAIMDHPNIARVLDGGQTASGRPYFVMDLVKGQPITDYCDQAQLTARERLELFVHLCQAVQHAHQKGIIHRDLKPSNVLVTVHDTTPVVKVIDFGVAKALGQELTDKTVFTGFAQMVGTPLYMSPEQAGQSGLDVDTRSDIYALGVLLYELLTGTTPFDKERLKQLGYDELRRIIREEEPPRPSTRMSTLGKAALTLSTQRKSDPQQLSQLFRGELDWIVMRCLEKDRNRRYETANGLAKDLQRYLNDEPVLACPPSAWYRFRKFARRHRRVVVTAAAAALAAVAAVAALATTTFLIAREHQAKTRALQAETHARNDLAQTIERERREAYFHRITLAHWYLSDDDLGRALKLLKECPEDLREWEWFYLMRLCRVEPMVLQDKTEVNGVAFSQDGERLVSAGGDGAVKIWNTRTGQVDQTFPAHAGSVVSVAFHPDGKHLASVGTDRQVRVWDLTTGKEVFTGRCDVIRKFGSAYNVAFSPPDGRKLAAGSEGTVKVWDWKNRQLLHAFAGHKYDSISVAFSHDGRRLATGAGPEGQKVWDTEAGGLPLHTFLGHRHPVSALAFSPDDGRLASASFDRTVKVWETTTGTLLHTLPHTGNVECVAFSPDGRRLASSGEDKTVRLWEAATGREVLRLRGHKGSCSCVAFSPDGRRLASASTDGTIRFWDATALQEDEGQPLLTFTQHREEIRSVAFSPDGKQIASAEFGTFVKIWDAATGKLTFDFNGDKEVFFCLAWQPDGQRIASAGWDGRLHAVQVWDAHNGLEAFRLPPGGENFAVAYQALAFSPDGRYLVTGERNGAVQVWDAQTGREVVTLGCHAWEIRGVVFSPDGRYLASASRDGKLKLWDATRLEAKQEPQLTLSVRVPGPSSNVAFSPDGSWLATGGEENTIKIWDVQSGRELHTLRGHSGEVYTVAFSPRGRWVASGGEDSTVKIWDSHTGTLVRTLRGHTGLVSSVAFSPDGSRLASGSRDCTVKVWDLTPLREIPER
jgi:WD40 repeat protein/serine/threonine protein kinase